MNDDKIIEHMIQFIESKERDLQAATLISSNQNKTDLVQSVLKELEREIKNEDSEN